ncbi:MAG: sporulation protein SsgA, partial [Marmoricola sp.]|nr:sporulation protein SsgA [Marmoricola sp.]
MDKPSPRTTTTVRATVPFLSGDAQSELLEGLLVFDPADPFAVAMHLEARSGTVVWTFARELLAEGLYTPSGDGDVQVWPCLSQNGS